MKKKLLIITPIKHIKNLFKNFSKKFKVTYKPEIKNSDLYKIIDNFEIIFTNPNKSNIYFDKKLLLKAKKLQIISTASTGTNHIDEYEAHKLNIKILSLKKEKKYMKQISSTAELAFALMLCIVRNIISSNKSVIQKNWDYYPFIGRQLDSLKIGVVGYGRLGKMFLGFLKGFGSDLYAYDPNIKIKNNKIKQCKSLKALFKNCNIVSVHVHLNNKTKNLINKKNLKFFKNGGVLINTSRGELVNEKHLLAYLKKNKMSKYGTDVLEGEINGIKKNIIIKNFTKRDLKNRILITPHIGGMTKEAQQMAYTYSFNKLIKNI